MERSFASARVETLRAAQPLAGQEKWLGGMGSPCGRWVYGVPGGAKTVLRISTETGVVDEIGGPYPGEFKWLRGVEVPASVMGEKEFPCGACFALPSNADCVLRIDPNTQSVVTFGGKFEGDWLWHGGCLGNDGMIYAVPANAKRVLRINPRTSETDLIGPMFEGRQKWYGGVTASNGSIYCIPQNGTGVLKITPGTGECSLVADGQLPSGGWKWHGGLATASGEIVYGFPNNANVVLKIDTRNDQVSLLGGPDVLKSGRHRTDNKYKYLGGAIAADGHVYCFPCDAERVLKINTSTDEVSLVGPELLQGEGKQWNSNKFQHVAESDFPTVGAI